MASNEQQALEILERERYVVLATADADGLPWASPVWYAHIGLGEILWLSRPYRTHSRNLADRADLAMVVFDSRQPSGTGLGVYLRGTAAIVPEHELEQALVPFSARSAQDGGSLWPADRVRELPVELYRATITEVSLLPGNGTDERLPVLP